MSKKVDEKCIRVALKNGDYTKVKVNFYGGMFTPEEFTSIFMSILDTYTAGLLESNTPEQVFEHFNRVFGIFLHRILPEKKIYEHSPAHKELKEIADKTLLAPETEEVRKETEENRLAAYILTRDVLIKDIGLEPTAADYILSKRLGTLKEVPVGGEKATKKGTSRRKSKKST